MIGSNSLRIVVKPRTELFYEQMKFGAAVYAGEAVDHKGHAVWFSQSADAAQRYPDIVVIYPRQIK